MLIGIAGAQALNSALGGGGGSALYPDAFIELDFIGGNYFVNGVAAALTGIFNESCSVVLSGLDCSSGAKTFKGDAYSAAATNLFCTVVSEFTYVLATTGNYNPYWVHDGSGNGLDIFGDRNGVSAQEYTGSGSLFLSWDGPFSDTSYDMPSTSRVAVTRTSGRLAITANGYDPANYTTGTSVSWTPTVAAIGDATGGKTAGLRMRKFVLMSPQLDADLPALSTI